MAQTWWIWVVGGLAIGVLELLAPGYLFLGFMAGALGTGFLVWSGLTGGSLPFTLVLFGAMSLFAWGAMRRWLGTRAGDVKRIDRDINDN